jgi:hypothetical protein
MEIEKIKKSILEIRGVKVILDFELAKMYQTETKRLKESVRRNIRRFPNDFMFELTTDEWENLRSQIATSSWGGKRYLPFAFSEQGVAMLSSVLNSEIAIEANIAIMRAFVLIRQFALTYKELSDQLKELEKRHNQQFNDIEEVLKYLIKKEKQSSNKAERKQIGFKE